MAALLPTPDRAGKGQNLSSTEEAGHMAATPISSGFGRGLCLAAVSGLILTHFSLVPLPHPNILRCPHVTGSWVQITAPSGKVDATDKLPVQATVPHPAWAQAQWLPAWG